MLEDFELVTHVLRVAVGKRVRRFNVGSSASNYRMPIRNRRGAPNSECMQFNPTCGDNSDNNEEIFRGEIRAKPLCWRNLDTPHCDS